jgi:DNA-binding NtrC family response regulator
MKATKHSRRLWKLRKLAKRILEMNGYTVLEAGNADEAIWIYQHYEEPIHLMITDIVMPGLSGRALAERLLQLGHEIKVLYMSGYTEDTIVHHGVSDADMPFLQKPFTPDTLTSKVREVLSEPAK